MYREIIARLYEALAREVFEVTIGDQTVKYASKSELLKAISKFEALQAAEDAVAMGGTGGGYRTRATAAGRFL